MRFLLTLAVAAAAFVGSLLTEVVNSHRSRKQVRPRHDYDM